MFILKINPFHFNIPARFIFMEKIDEKKLRKIVSKKSVEEYIKICKFLYKNYPLVLDEFQEEQKYKGRIEFLR